MTEQATFAAGCFWGVEETFRKTPGVVSTMVGYTAGVTPNPTYQQVCTDETGHVEAVQMTFDPAVISYEDLLDLFWRLHDPTTLNRQGPDVGSQYRSAVFYHSEVQKEAALTVLGKIETSGRFRSPIVTQIVPAETFYPAEDYHQQYFAKRGGGHCHIQL